MNEAKLTGLKARLNRIDYGARDINVYTFSPIDGSSFPDIEPGAHIDLNVQDSVVRSYSLINAGSSPAEYQIAVHKNVTGRGGAHSWHKGSVVGEVYQISMPRNHFALNESPGVTSCFFAGGIGVTPIINMYRRLKLLGRPAQMYYWARTTQDFLFLAELQADQDVTLYPTDEMPAWRTVADILGEQSMDTHVYCCGPEPMLEQFLSASADRLEETVHFERFAGKAIALPQDCYTVQLKRSGITLDVGSGESILSACLRKGLEVSYSCEEGICGACEVKVLAGEVTHLDSVKSAAQHKADGTMIICCSHPANDGLVLDL